MRFLGSVLLLRNSRKTKRVAKQFLARLVVRAALFALFAFGPHCFAQNWAVGVSGGYSAYHDVTINNGAGGSADAGFGSRFAVGAVLTEDMYEHIGGELRYNYLAGDSALRFSGNEVKMDAFSQALHYDFLFYATPRRSRIRPYAAGGAGIKRYDGSGRPYSLQPLSDFAVLTHNHQVEGMISFGGGVKFALGDRWVLRLDFRDYATPLPTKLFAAPKTAAVNGWLQDFVPMVGVDWTFGGR